MSDLRMGERVFVVGGARHGAQGIVTGGGVEMPGIPETYMVRTGLGANTIEAEVPRAEIMTVNEWKQKGREFGLQW